MTRRWLYLAFFNGLWVVLPVYILYEVYGSLSASMPTALAVKKTK